MYEGGGSVGHWNSATLDSDEGSIRHSCRRVQGSSTRVTNCVVDSHADTTRLMEEQEQ